MTYNVVRGLGYDGQTGSHPSQNDDVCTTSGWLGSAEHGNSQSSSAVFRRMKILVYIRKKMAIVERIMQSARTAMTVFRRLGGSMKFEVDPRGGPMTGALSNCSSSSADTTGMTNLRSILSRAESGYRSKEGGRTKLRLHVPEFLGIYLKQRAPAEQRGLETYSSRHRHFIAKLFFGSNAEFLCCFMAESYSVRFTFSSVASASAYAHQRRMHD